MASSVIAVYDENQYKKAVPMVWDGTTWHPCRIKCYDELMWKQCGGAGTLFLYLADANGNYILDSNGNYILVRMDSHHSSGNMIPVNGEDNDGQL